MILYAWATEQSVAACFLATILPGFLLVVIYSIIHQLFTRKMPNVQHPLKIKGYWRIFARSASRASLVLLLPVLVLGSIYGGFATPTESATVGIVFSLLLICVVYRQAGARLIANVLVKGTTLAGVLIIMVFFIMILSRIFSLYNLPTLLASTILGLTSNKYLILFIINILLLVIGMLMDDASGTILAAPLLLPIVVGIGVSPIQFAAIVGTNLGLGNVTPPTAPILYLGGRVGGVTLDKYLKYALVFMLGALPVIFITTYVPAFSLFLPRLLMGVE